ncbi:MAG: HU family DNA-binding protein [Candidatus Eremiobacteraeota bacterium]|nr:HU family DNA-binding protein [Candidatus Eremiobacteraeota bacterium]
MTKAELIESLADEHEMSRRQVGEMVDMLLDEITGALQKGEKVALTPFGSFVVRARKKREGRNPKTGEKITIAARKVPAFQAGKALKDAVGGARTASKASKKKSSGGAKKSAAKKSPAKKSTAKKGGKKR